MALGLVASIFLVFSDNLQYTRIGLVAALWAAAIGALAATKYRKDAAVDNAKVRDLQTVYELQLEREITARREYEMGVEARVREEVGADAAEMAALRAELTVLRESLQRLFDGDLPMDRPALRADATRVQELPRAHGSPANGSSPNANGRPDMMTPIFSPDHPAPPAFATPYDEPVTAETSVVTVDDEYDTGPISTPAGWADAFTDPGETAAHPYAPDDPDTDVSIGPPLPPSGWFGPELDDTGRGASLGSPDSAEPFGSPEAAAAFGSQEAAADAEGPFGPPTPARPEAQSVPRRLPPPEESARPSIPETPAAPVIGTSSTRRRRRVADEENGDTGRRLSVAEIMANLQSERGGDG